MEDSTRRTCTKLNNPDDLKQLRDAGHLAYATFGTDNLFEPAFRMTHNDGNPSLELKYVSHNIEKPDWREERRVLPTSSLKILNTR